MANVAVSLDCFRSIRRGAAKVAGLGLLLAAGGLASPFADAAPVFLDFATDQYGSNFVETLNPARLSYDGTNKRVAYAAGTMGQSAITRYDSNPGNSQYDDADIQSETVAAAFSFSGFSSTRSAGVITRVQTTGAAQDKGVMAIVNPNSATEIQIRLYAGTSVTDSSVIGTKFYDGTFALSTGVVTSETPGGTASSTNGIAINSPVTLSLAQSSAADPVFNLTVSDAEGFVASTGDRTLLSTLSDAYDGPGAVAFRLAAPTNATGAFDDFTITPEPSSAALALAVSGIALYRRRRSL